MRPRPVLPRCLLLLCALGAAASATADDYEDRAEALEAVRERIRALDQQLDERDEKRDVLRAALQDAEQAATDAAGRLSDIRQRMAVLRENQEEANTRVRDAEAALRQRHQALAAQIQAAWRLGRQPQVKLLFQQDDPAQLTRMRAYFERVGTATHEEIARTREAQAELESAVDSLEDSRQALQATEHEQEQLLARLESRRAQRERTLKALQKRVQNDRKALEAAKRDENRLEAVVRELRAALADIPPNAGADTPLDELRGKLAWPIRGPVLASFGTSKPSGLAWKGIWVAAEAGTPARAIAAGRVAWAGWMHRYGLVVILEHTGGYFSLYGHAQRSLRRTGDWVDAGAPVVTAGDTGGQSRSGVYLELRDGADPVDPIGWLQARD